MLDYTGEPPLVPVLDPDLEENEVDPDLEENEVDPDLLHIDHLFPILLPSAAMHKKKIYRNY